MILSSSPSNTLRDRQMLGFTLIELMVVIAIVGILASVAYPSYMGQTRKSRRADAVAALTRLQQAQERWRSNQSSYATDAQMTTAAPDGLGLTASTDNGYYALSITNSVTNAYTATAAAVSGKSQASDTGCTTLTVAVSGGNPTYTPSICWSR